MLLGAAVARAVFVWLREVVGHRGAVEAKRRVRERLLERLLAPEAASGGAGRVGELVTTAVEGVERLGPYFALYRPQVALAGLVPALVSACVLYLDPLSGLVLLCMEPAIPVLMVLIGKQAEERTRLQWEALSRMGHTSWMRCAASQHSRPSAAPGRDARRCPGSATSSAAGRSRCCA